MSATKKTLPKGWHWTNLGDVAEYINGRAFKPKDWKTSGIPIIRIQNLNTEEAAFNYFDGDVEERYIVENGDLLISWSASLDAFIWNRGTAILNQHIFKAIENKEVIRRDYFFYAVKEAMEEIRSQVHGATMKHITRPEFLAITIPLPPLDEQERIAARLDQQMRQFELARQSAEESLFAAWELPSAYLSSVFDDSHGQQWKWEKLGDVCELLPAKAIKTIGDTSVTAITSACLTENGFSPDGLKSARMDKNDAEVALVKKDEILIARSNTPELVGRVSIYPGDPPNVVASDLTIRIWAKPSYYPPFLNAYLSFLYLRGYWKERAGGASGTMKKITRSQLLSIEVPIPSIENQKKIVDELQENMNHFKQLEQSLESQLTEINQLPSALLRQAFEGEL